VALAILGCGIGPTLVAQYSLAATLSPAGRSATTMTMLGSAVVVGQAVSSAATGAVVDQLGASAALALPAVTAAFVVAAGIAHAASVRRVEPRELVPA
jgi:MFS family permease